MNSKNKTIHIPTKNIRIRKSNRIWHLKSRKFMSNFYSIILLNFLRSKYGIGTTYDRGIYNTNG